MDANELTGMRTARMSALAARYLARADGESIGFVGCGQRARGHLNALCDVLPHLQIAVTYSAHLSLSKDFAAETEQRGRRAGDGNPDDVLACDVVVTRVADGRDLVPFLDASKLVAGRFVSAVDLGRSWMPDSLSHFDLAVTDGQMQANHPEIRRKLSYQGAFDFDLARLITNPQSRRHGDDERILFLFPGFAVADLIVASLAYQSALAGNTEIWLPR